MCLSPLCKKMLRSPFDRRRLKNFKLILANVFRLNLLYMHGFSNAFYLSYVVVDNYIYLYMNIITQHL